MRHGITPAESTKELRLQNCVDTIFGLECFGKQKEAQQTVMTLLTRSLASLAAAYVLTLAGLAVFQRRLQYFPDRRLTELAQTDMSGGEELRLTTADGETLVAWYFPANEGRPLILYFHGNAGALVDRIPRFRMFTAHGYGLLAVSYRGYGGSTGSPTENGLMQDGEAAYREARARGYDGDRIILMADLTFLVIDRGNLTIRPKPRSRMPSINRAGHVERRMQMLMRQRRSQAPVKSVG
jgi:hypothetical protein